jgi:predicted RNase H-like HicB family nuclease
VKRTFTASMTHEGDWFIAQCLEVDVASQGETAEEAQANPGEALALSFASPVTTAPPDLRQRDVENCVPWQPEAGGAITSSPENWFR